MNIKTTFQRKPDFCFHKFKIEKSIKVTNGLFEELLYTPLKKQAFIASNKDLMYQDGEGVYHSLLVTDEGGTDGLLVESEGSDYVTYGAYVPEATALCSPSRSKTNRDLAAVVEFIVADRIGQTIERNWVLTFAEIEEKTSLCVNGNPFLQEMLRDMLSDHPKVADLTIEDE